MGFPKEVQRLRHALLGGANIRQIVLPADAVVVLNSGAGAYGWGAWTDIALAATVTLETMVVGCYFFAAPLTVVSTVDIGSCQVAGINYANAVAVIAAVAAGTITNAQVHRAELPFTRQTAAGDYMPMYLEYPVYIPAGAGIIARVQESIGANVFNMRLICVQGH